MSTAHFTVLSFILEAKDVVALQSPGIQLETDIWLSAIHAFAEEQAITFRSLAAAVSNEMSLFSTQMEGQ